MLYGSFIDPISNDTVSDRKMFVYGATLAFLLIGVFSDAVLKGKSLYLLMVILIGIEAVICVIVISVSSAISGP